MRVDLDELAERAVAAAPAAPTPVAVIGGRVRARQRRRVGAVAASVLLSAVVVGAALVQDGDADGGPLVAGPSTSAEARTRHEAAGVSVLLPNSWTFTTDDLTPSVSDPRVLWAASTSLPVRGNDRCAHMPTAALDALASDGVLLVLFERRIGLGHPERAARLWDMRGEHNNDDSQLCSSGSFTSWWFPFEDGGRSLYLFIAVGPAVKSTDAIATIVDSITITG